MAARSATEKISARSRMALAIHDEILEMPWATSPVADAAYLSGGQRQRISTGPASSQEPPI